MHKFQPGSYAQSTKITDNEVVLQEESDKQVNKGLKPAASERLSNISAVKPDKATAI